MKTWVNVYDLDLQTIEDIKIGDVITQGNTVATVIDILYDWDHKDGAWIKFSTKEGQKTFRMDFDKNLNPGHIHKSFKEKFNNPG